ncbi:bifunctional ADP-dependent NAD(P)H-hydrate dehydratase/NAD(P)H-hydrate epimerase [Desulfospira joergensenii]|uniref:bifunctional ADP-dependent NAD(P)H-hydrate dehydratase/NAD(P)H-hydrate epimerase n=1 Tax=Desulfospira joergensenii TaxID=53329 RepID=UPI0003B328F1|nr:bifunctional ADP-dependent NAD(P)H-hydrate dehydratase/NAD(P)H-hydrate epimerase [Desulfospira joergensenii]
MLLVTASQMQNMDSFTINSLGLPGQVLMENAGKGAFDMLVRRFDPDESTRVCVVAGRGNNGGDGFVIARYLMDMGIPVTLFLLSTRDRVKGDARANCLLAKEFLSHHKNSKIIEIPDSDTLEKNRARFLHQDIFVDAIFGTGLNSEVRGFFRDVIQMINHTGRPVFSVDIPSGLNSDTGRPLGIAVRASATATFAHAKAGHFLYPGNEYTGDLEIIDIGIPGFVAAKEDIRLNLVQAGDITPLFPPRPFDSHKGSFGHVLVLAGSPGKTGAAALCANAAMRSGAGLVTLGLPQSLNSVLEPQVIEPMTFPLAETKKGSLSLAAKKAVLGLADGRQALALGPGIGTHEETKKLVCELIKEIEIPMVIDADGLNSIADRPDILKSARAPVVLTPHPGEMARLGATTPARIQEDRPGMAGKFAKEYQVILVLKGAQTLIALPDGRVFINPTGNPGMASGGMGDVLTGMIAGFAAQGFSLEDAALAGVYLHGLAGDILAKTRGEFGFLASDLVQTIPSAIHEELPCQA